MENFYLWERAFLAKWAGDFESALEDYLDVLYDLLNSELECDYLYDVILNEISQISSFFEKKNQEKVLNNLYSKLEKYKNGYGEKGGIINFDKVLKRIKNILDTESHSLAKGVKVIRKFYSNGNRFLCIVRIEGISYLRSYHKLLHDLEMHSIIELVRNKYEVILEEDIKTIGERGKIHYGKLEKNEIQEHSNILEEIISDTDYPFFTLKVNNNIDFHIGKCGTVNAVTEEDVDKIQEVFENIFLGH